MKKFEIKVPETDFIIKSDTIYTVIPKPDPNAPDAFREHGTTKIIHPDISDTIGAPYSTEMGVWDTGFYEFSPCLVGMNSDEKEAFISLVTKAIVEPIEQIKGKGTLEHRNNEFYDELVIPLYNKVSFNTADPMQLLGLYFAVLSKQLCPKDNVGNPNFKYAAYQVVNREKEVTNLEQIKIDNTKAIGEFYKLMSTDKEKLSIIMKYLNISSTVLEDEDTFISVFSNYLEDKQDGYRNSKIFLQQLNKFDTAEGQEELYIYEALSKLYDQKKLKLFKQEYYLGTHNLGGSIKHAAMTALVNPEIQKLITEMSEVKEVEDVKEVQDVEES